MTSGHNFTDGIARTANPQNVSSNAKTTTTTTTTTTT